MDYRRIQQNHTEQTPESKQQETQKEELQNSGKCHKKLLM